MKSEPEQVLHSEPEQVLHSAPEPEAEPEALVFKFGCCENL
jgi:hypothetical protein